MADLDDSCEAAAPYHSYLKGTARCSICGHAGGIEFAGFYAWIAVQLDITTQCPKCGTIAVFTITPQTGDTDSVVGRAPQPKGG